MIKKNMRKIICLSMATVMFFAMTTVPAEAAVSATAGADVAGAMGAGFSVTKTIGPSTVALKKKKKLKRVKLTKPKNFNAWASSCYEGNLTWTAGKNAQGYRVYRSLYKKKKFKKIATVTGTSFYDNTLAANTVYYYKIRAYRGKKTTGYTKVKKIQTTVRPNGNAACYDVANVGVLPENNLKDKTIFFLGSSITYGSASGGQSFADYVAKRNQLNYSPEMKEAISGTTMACIDNGKSYVERISNLANIKNAEEHTAVPDIFMCQLSINDANHVGEIGESNPKAVVDQATEARTVGQAIDYIIDYAHKHWPKAKIAFYTCRNTGNCKYASMVSLLNEAKAAWNHEGVDIAILDLWSDSAIKNLYGDAYVLYMNCDANHPTKAGYLQLWTPRFEKFLLNLIELEVNVEEQQPEPQIEEEQLQQEEQQPQEQPEEQQLEEE